MAARNLMPLRVLLPGLCVAVHARPGSSVSACIDCGGTPCLESACKAGACLRDKMVADGQAAGLSVDVPARCERQRLYSCEHLPERRLLRCAAMATTSAPAPAAAAASAPAPAANTLAPAPAVASSTPARAAAPTNATAAVTARPPLPSAAVSLTAAGGPQVYPPSWMTGERAPKYFTVPYLEDRKGITYDGLSKDNDWTVSWNEGSQRDYFLPNVEYERNLNYEASKDLGKWGMGLSIGQWMVIFTLLYLNGDPAVTKQMLLPLIIIGAGQALMPALLPEKEWSNYDKHFPKPLTRTVHNELTNPDQGGWPRNRAVNWPGTSLPAP